MQPVVLRIFDSIFLLVTVECHQPLHRDAPTCSASCPTPAPVPIAIGLRRPNVFRVVISGSRDDTTAKSRSGVTVLTEREPQTAGSGNTAGAVPMRDHTCPRRERLHRRERWNDRQRVHLLHRDKASLLGATPETTAFSSRTKASRHPSHRCRLQNGSHGSVLLDRIHQRKSSDGNSEAAFVPLASPARIKSSVSGPCLVAAHRRR